MVYLTLELKQGTKVSDNKYVNTFWILPCVQMDLVNFWLKRCLRRTPQKLCFGLLAVAGEGKEPERMLVSELLILLET